MKTAVGYFSLNQCRDHIGPSVHALVIKFAALPPQTLLCSADSYNLRGINGRQQHTRPTHTCARTHTQFESTKTDHTFVPLPLFCNKIGSRLLIGREELHISVPSFYNLIPELPQDSLCFLLFDKFGVDNPAFSSYHLLLL